MVILPNHCDSARGGTKVKVGATPVLLISSDVSLTRMQEMNSQRRIENISRLIKSRNGLGDRRLTVFLHLLMVLAVGDEALRPVSTLLTVFVRFSIK